MDVVQQIYQFYINGRYQEAINISRAFQNNQGSNFDIDYLTLECLIKGNYSAEALHYYNMLWHKIFEIERLQIDPNEKQAVLQKYSHLMRTQNICLAMTKISHDLNLIKNKSLVELGLAEIGRKVAVFCDGLLKEVDVIPLLWPLAYGDMIIANQWIKQLKKDKPIVVLIPLNRPEIKELFESNDSIDYLFDLTLAEAERDRQQTLFMNNEQGCSILALQERIILEILGNLNYRNIIKFRYLPMLDGYKIMTGFRMWEKRAEVFLADGTELPKLYEFGKTEKKQIAIHVRNANYSDAARNMSDAQAQDLIWELKKKYPKYKIVRLGDSKMQPLVDCYNASHDDLSVEEQAKIIAESRLFIGTHSAPQHLAVACSDTPVICTHYCTQETCQEMTPNIPRLSYEPVGKQVKAILYNKMYDNNGNEVIPSQHNKHAARVEQPTIEQIMVEVGKVLG